MFNTIKKDSTERMQKSITALKSELSKLRTGRAHPSLLEQVMVTYYGNPTPLNQVANVNVSDAQTLVVSPWEKNIINDVDKAIRDSGLGLNPIPGSDNIRVPLPPLTEERRKDLTKLVKQEGESAKVAIRNIRRDANNQLKALLKDKEITEDEERRYQDEVQKLTDKHITEIDSILSAKESELMEI